MKIPKVLFQKKLVATSFIADYKQAGDTQWLRALSISSKTTFLVPQVNKVEHKFDFANITKPLK